MASDESAGKSLLESQPEESAGKSLLEKPLHQLTEDDIAQLTREDCRRYLKEKGMRRPSWNKSQAIQQVIMLKKLLEADSEAGSRKLPNNAHSSNTAILSVPKGISRDAKISVSVEKTTPHHIKDLNKPDYSVGFSGRFASTKDESAQPRTRGTTNVATGQMTIFYCGKVNVYDDMPAEKARAIMHLASSPLQFPEEQLNDATIVQPLPRLSKGGVSAKARQGSADVISPTLRTASMRDNSLVLGEENIVLREENPGGPSTRKASVQRYLEKRKDRYLE
ncbi:protein tify 4b [Phtheirospermum japonicum]|uniref:Protein TIFY n=1 Tax=Phtheirospermum japonicum TaxID=374723 RepID=A0A830DIA5_9LAMI|nr:protein tify 4b [Phtheirospermum japonicum]